MKRNIKITFHVAATAASLLLFAVLLVFKAKAMAVYVPTNHVDGAFQTLSALVRMDVGQLPGKDFFPYLGIGPVFSLFPFFKLAGSDLCASVFAAHFVLYTSWWLVLSTAWQFIFVPKSMAISFLFGAVIFLILSFYSNYEIVNMGYSTGFSLMPIRASLPWIVALSLYFFLARDVERGGAPRGTVNVMRYFVPCLSVISIALLWSNDYAAVVAFVFTIFCAIFILNIKGRAGISYVIALFAGVPLTYFLILSFATGFSPIAMLKYNFVSVAGDQFWYFLGGYKIYTLKDALLMIHLSGYALIVLLLVFWVAIRTKRQRYILLFCVGLSLFLGGAVSCLGGQLDPRYFLPFNMWMRIVSFYFLLYVLYASSQKMSVHRAAARIKDFFILASVALLFLCAVFHYMHYYRMREAAAVDAEMFYVDEFGGWVESEWKSYIDFIREHIHSDVREEYFGLWGAMAGRFGKVSPWPVDSLIHALGDVRDETRRLTEGAEFFVVTRPDYTVWSSWNFSINYWFYDEFLHSSDLVFSAPTLLVFHKGVENKNRMLKKVPCGVDADGELFAIQVQSPHLFYRVGVEYEVNRRGRAAVGIRNNISLPSFPLNMPGYGYVALPPYGKHAVFPVFVPKMNEAEMDIYNVAPEKAFFNAFDLTVFGNAVASLKKCDASIIEGNDYLLSVFSKRGKAVYRDFYGDDFYSYNTNSFRTFGVGMWEPKLFVLNTPKNRDFFRPGYEIIFADGSSRKIAYVWRASGLLHVHFDGPLFNQRDIGRPSAFKARKL